MPEAARVTDLHTCPKVEPGPVPHVGGPILPAGSPDIEIDFLPAVRAGEDKCFCAVCAPDYINQGCSTVFFNNKPAVRMGDSTDHGGVIVGGSGTVEIGVPGDGVKVPVPKSEASAPAKRGKGGSGKGGGGGGKGGAGDSEGDGNSGDGSGNGPGAKDPTKKTGVTAEFELAGPKNLAIEHEATFRCRSWDPDTGGTPESPNPSAIPTRKWTLSGEGVYLDTTTDQVEWTVKLRGNLPDEKESTIITVELSVTDAQGDQDTTSQTFEVRANSLIAVIGDYIGTQRGEVARTGSPGEITVAPNRQGVLKSLSYLQKGNGEQITEGIEVMWTVLQQGSNAYSLSSSRMLNHTFKEGYTDVTLECFAEGKRASAKLRVVSQTAPTPVISGYTVEPGIESFQRSISPNIILEGDTVVMHSGSYPLDAITAHRWNVYLGSTSVSNRERNTIDAEFFAYAGGLSVQTAQVTVTLSVVDYNDAQSRDVTTQLTIHPILTVANATKLMALKLLEAGVAVAASLLATWTMGGSVTWAMAIPAISSMVVEQGLTDLGTPPLLASILAGAAEVGADAVVLSLSRGKYVDIVMRKVEAAFPNNVERQMDLAAEMFQEYKGARLPGAVKASLGEAFEEVLETLGNRATKKDINSPQ